jgi:hypothetical protein
MDNLSITLSLKKDNLHPDVIRRAVCGAVKKIGHVTQDAFDDMLQAAWAQTLQYTPADAHEAMHYQMAQWGAYKHFFNYELENRKAWNDETTRVSPHLSLEEDFTTDAGDEELATEQTDPTARTLPVTGGALIALLAHARKHGSNKPANASTLRAATKDAKILELLAQGYNNRGIAQELGTNPDNIRAHRWQICKILKSQLVA